MRTWCPKPLDDGAILCSGRQCLIALRLSYTTCHHGQVRREVASFRGWCLASFTHRLFWRRRLLRGPPAQRRLLSGCEGRCFSDPTRDGGKRTQGPVELSRNEEVAFLRSSGSRIRTSIRRFRDGRPAFRRTRNIFCQVLVRLPLDARLHRPEILGASGVLLSLLSSVVPGILGLLYEDPRFPWVGVGRVELTILPGKNRLHYQLCFTPVSWRRWGSNPALRVKSSLLYP